MHYLQQQILSLFVRIHYFFYILFGLWPFDIQKPLTSYYLYAIAFGSFINYVNPTCAMFLVRHFTTYKSSNVSTKFQLFVVVMQVIVLAVISVHQIMFMHRHIEIVVSFRKVVRKLRPMFSRKPVNLTSSLIIYAVSFYAVNILKAYGNYGRYKFQATPSDKIDLQVSMILLVNFVVSFLPAHMCAVMLAFICCFKQINYQIEIILRRATFGATDVLRNGYRRRQMTMQMFCDLTDRLDLMAMLHFKLTKLATAFIALYSFQFIVFTCWKLVTSIFQIFVIYSTLSNNSRIKKRVLWLMAANVMAVLADFLILIVTNYVCATVSNEVSVCLNYLKRECA